MESEDLPLQVQVDQWRQKAIAGQLTNEELRAAIQVLRQGRMTAAANTTKAKTAVSKQAASKAAEDILGELDI